MTTASLPYHEPGIITILIHTSFLLLLNIGNFVLDHTLYCGLLGQIFLGIAWGTPGAKWLTVETEEVIVQLGYLGLLLLVYEGGLSTSLKAIKANILLSSCVAITGIALPIGLSFALLKLCDATPLQAFAAGAALCSTSLGTTFTVLGSTGLIQARLGVVLTSAAMMDDVVGLVMVQVISNLGSSGASISAVTIIRPLLVSVAFAACAPVACVFVAKPITLWLNVMRTKSPLGFLNRLLMDDRVAWLIHTLILIGCIAGSSYAGTSNLFAAYIAGTGISWWDSEVPHPKPPVASTAVPATIQDEAQTTESPTVNRMETSEHRDQHPEGSNSSGLFTFEKYYAQSLYRILRPFFFASIGFSIPITEMFSSKIVWKGLVYTALMIVGKMACGIWLLRISFAPTISTISTKFTAVMRFLRPKITNLWGRPHEKSASPRNTTNNTRQTQPPSSSSSHQARSTRPTTETSDPALIKPRSIYPASILGCAMAARGEIGFLISSVAESNHIFAIQSNSAKNSEIFLVVTWAIMLCTILGPLAVGLVVRRVERLQQGVQRQGRLIQGDVLGVWGLS
ncbi:Sodium/hydrogen exchanger [Annulohypoxylon maeteangense]|uniref:Sodium/hydrogen exchanger n=1 Tax=Annulohypoxylon maeteangense TaxID=1927788 RepID=UPI0020073B6F|nr:Sodium/hydrogen exchanger [Annulohypoxylon maeteangense]KAI0885026.1 Sodium/hydrogen exchanger [Annulohypoxylon maeteangense]